MIKIHGIEAFNDNYIWCIFNEKNNAIIVDPGCAKSVDAFLTKHNLNLEAILITHHHFDHIGGVKQLKEKHSPKIYGYKGADFDFLDFTLVDGQKFKLLELEFKTIEVPGHTLDHIAFFVDIPSSDIDDNKVMQPSLFSGDTLFSAGCGRLFEGTAEQMFSSLNKLAALPANTLIYCAHEYTLSNLAFAKSLMPNNKDLSSYISLCEEKRQQGLATVPSTLSTELKINPFLRNDDPEIYSSLKNRGLIKTMNELEVFRATRMAKDNF